MASAIPSKRYASAGRGKENGKYSDKYSDNIQNINTPSNTPINNNNTSITNNLTSPKGIIKMKTDSSEEGEGSEFVYCAKFASERDRAAAASSGSAQKARGSGKQSKDIDSSYTFLSHKKFSKNPANGRFYRKFSKSPEGSKKGDGLVGGGKCGSEDALLWHKRLAHASNSKVA
jgi:hypothetical protein